MDIDKLVEYNEFVAEMHNYDTKAKELDTAIRLYDGLKADPSTLEYIKHTQYADQLMISVEEFATLPQETLVEMCMEGLWDTIKNILKAIWETIMNICQKVIRFIKSFFNPKNDTLEDKVNAYFGILDSNELSAAAKSTPLLMDMYDFDQIEARIKAHLDIFTHVLNPIRPGEFNWVIEFETPQNGYVEFKCIDDIIKDIKSLIRQSHPNAGYRFMTNNSLNFEMIRLLSQKNIWNSPWDDKIRFMNLVNLTKTTDANISALVTLGPQVEQLVKSAEMFWNNPEDPAQNRMARGNEYANAVVENSKTLLKWFEYVRSIAGDVAQLHQLLITCVIKAQKKVGERIQSTADKMRA